MVTRCAVVSEFRVRIPALSFFSFVGISCKYYISGWGSFYSIFLFFYFFYFFNFLLLLFIFYFFVFLFFIFLFFIFYFLFFYFFIFLFFYFSFFYFFIFNFIFIYYFFIFSMTSSPTHPSPLFFFSFTHQPLPDFFLPPPTPPSFFLFFPHPPLPSFFLLSCRRFPNFCRRFPKCCPGFIGSQGSHDVRLMSFFWAIFRDDVIDFRPTIFNNQSEASIFQTIFRRFFRRCSPPIRSQEIDDVIFVKLGRKGPTVLLRYIGENVRLLFDVIEHAQENEIPGLLFFADFEKVFDTLNHNFIMQALNFFKFGNDLKQWISVFYQDCTSCVINNGYASPFFNICRGVRQGCPLSPCLFIICIDLLAIAIRNDTNLEGISILNCDAEKEIKIFLYADDTTLLLPGKEEALRQVWQADCSNIQYKKFIQSNPYIHSMQSLYSFNSIHMLYEFNSI